MSRNLPLTEEEVQIQKQARLQESADLRTIGLTAHHVRCPVVPLPGPLEPNCRDFGRREQFVFEVPTLSLVGDFSAGSRRVSDFVPSVPQVPGREEGFLVGLTSHFQEHVLRYEPGC
eukprot:784703-Karenia_brevis.AAC.2